MKIYGNLPLNTPTLQAYRGSPLAAYLHFPDGYVMPDVTARLLDAQGTQLTSEQQPSVDVLGTLVAISLTQPQLATMPDYVRLLVAFDGVDKIGTRLELSAGVAAFPQSNVLNYDGADIRLSLYDLEAVNLARQYKEDALNAVGNIVVLVEEDPDGKWVELAFGGSITIEPGSQDDSPYNHVSITFPV